MAEVFSLPLPTPEEQARQAKLIEELCQPVKSVEFIGHWDNCPCQKCQAIRAEERAQAEPN